MRTHRNYQQSTVRLSAAITEFVAAAVLFHDEPADAKKAKRYVEAQAAMTQRLDEALCPFEVDAS